ncbi:DNA alkylation repair protein [Streptomyces sp. BB1-1-1]|uniref:DNA alkylation repair protein n=1 Tax=Streptomyces sp. BB1-1-1 TaxID=3074430 RepID=UPI002877B756|nr:DNA alkylation repair protein [Streptomyces sp. BB1-1-1]WND38808.1 DNA alkylation repair protein [Streptomyces sp. BB1-1-1]
MSVTAKGIPDVPRSPLADTVVERLTAVYAAAADPERAVALRAYMKDVAPFLGLTSPVRRSLSRTVLEGLPRPGESDCAAVALRCWRLPEREYHYFAVDLLRRYVTHCSSGFLPVVRHLLTTVPWWDTVDLLSAHVVGGLVAADRDLTADMDAWSADEDRWLVRAALLHQLRYRERTDTDRLFGYCLHQSGHGDFFVRKAIGWCLREYAKTDPDAVRAFVTEHRQRLAPLSVREALRNIGP